MSTKWSGCPCVMSIAPTSSTAMCSCSRANVPCRRRATGGTPRGDEVAAASRRRRPARSRWIRGRSAPRAGPRRLELHGARPRASSGPRKSSASAGTPGVAGGQELVRGGRRLVAQPAGRASSVGVDVLRGLLGGRDQHDVGPELQLEQARQQRVVRAAQDQRVDTPLVQRRKIPCARPSAARARSCRRARRARRRPGRRPSASSAPAPTARS